MRLFLLRHGETEFSRHERFCGGIDAPLTAAGWKMGELFADSYVSVVAVDPSQPAMLLAGTAGQGVVRTTR